MQDVDNTINLRQAFNANDKGGIQETQDSGRQNECKHPGKTRKPDIGNTKLETNSKHQKTRKREG